MLERLQRVFNRAEGRDDDEEVIFSKTPESGSEPSRDFVDADEGQTVRVSIGRKWYKARVLKDNGDGTFLLRYRSPNGVREGVFPEDRVLTEQERRSLRQQAGNTIIRR